MEFLPYDYHINHQISTISGYGKGFGLQAIIEGIINSFFSIINGKKN